MVVVHAQPSTSAGTQKKNRRRVSRKKSQNQTDGLPQNDNDSMHEDIVPVELFPAARAAIVEADTGNAEDDEVMVDMDSSELLPQSAAPAFPPLSASAQRASLKSETRRIQIPPHRMTPLKKEWVNIFGPLTEMLGLQVRMNVQRKCVEIRVCIIRFLRIFYPLIISE